jgi:hypothetical protein
MRKKLQNKNISTPQKYKLAIMIMRKHLTNTSHVLCIGLVRKVEFYIKFSLYIYIYGSKKESSKEKSCKEKEKIVFLN